MTLPQPRPRGAPFLLALPRWVLLLWPQETQPSLDPLPRLPAAPCHPWSEQLPALLHFPNPQEGPGPPPEAAPLPPSRRSLPGAVSQGDKAEPDTCLPQKDSAETLIPGASL